MLELAKIRCWCLSILAGTLAAARGGGEFPVSVTPGPAQSRPALAQLTGGNVAAVWECRTGSVSSIHLRLFSPQGSPAGPEQNLFGDAANDQRYPAIAGLDDGTMVVAWSRRNGDGSDYSVAFYVCSATGAPLTASPQQANSLTFGPQFHPRVAPLENGGLVDRTVAQSRIVPELCSW